MRVVIAGGSGFLGRGLALTCVRRGDDVTILGRSASPPQGVPRGTRRATWDGRTLGPWTDALDGADVVVNLVGRSVDCRKTPETRREILESRVDSCRVLGEACRAVARPPGVWVQAATAHIVGDPVPPTSVCDESTPPGPMHEMAPSVGVVWEKAFDDARLPTQRGVTLRISFVLGRGGGPLAKLARFTRLGLGGTVGSGRQWVSWIHEADLQRLILSACDDPAYEGVYVTTSPNPVTNRDFMRSLRRTMGMPWSPPAPALGVRLACRFVLNTDPELALLGRRCVPTRLIRQGFGFDFPDLDAALVDLLPRRGAA